MTPTAGGSGTSSPADRAVWTRVGGIQGGPLDLMAARIGRRHYAPHVHDEFAIGVTTDGAEVMRYRGGRVCSVRGDVVIVEPGEAHTGGPVDDDGFSYRVFYPSAELLTEGARALPHFGQPIVQDPLVSQELWTAHRALSQGDDPLEGESRLLWALNALVLRHAEPAARPTGETGRGAGVAREVATRLADELTAPPTLAELAADLGMSRYQVLRAFRDTMDMPPYAWLAQYRVGRARTLLEAGHRPAEAAVRVGFADQAHLTRWFRRVLGVTPGVYRNSVQDLARLARRD